MALSCPHCAIPLTSTEYSAGTCPLCGKGFDSTSVKAEAPSWKSAPEPSYRDPSELDRRAPLRWATVRTALSLVIVGVTGVAFGLVLIMSLGASRQADRQDDLLSEVVAPFALVGMAAGAVLFFTGMCLCVVVPGESGAKPWSWAYLCCLLFSMLVLVAISVASGENRKVQRRNLDRDMKAMRNFQFNAPQQEVAPERPPFPDQFFTVAFAIWIICLSIARNLFICFLCGVSWHFRQRALMISLLIFLALSLVGDIGFFVIAFKQPGFEMQRVVAQFFPNADSLYLLWLAVAGSLVYYVWFLIQLFLVRDSVNKELLRHFP